MRRALRYASKLLIAATLIGSPANATPEGRWPSDAMDMPLDPPSWVLVIPASRNSDGSLNLDKHNDWSEQWLVPTRTDNDIKLVAISWDDEDKQIFGADELDDMRIATLRKLSAKYMANAVAVVVADHHGDVAVAAWSRSKHATWSKAEGEGESFTAATTLIEFLYSGAGNQLDLAAQYDYSPANEPANTELPNE